jgi:TatD DNase family protein
MIFNTHTHLNDDKFLDNYSEVIEKSLDMGLKMVVVGYNLEMSKRAIAIAEQYDDVYASVGLHPSDSEVFSDDYMSELESMLSHDKVIAIGECGLDYYWDSCPRDIQEASFDRQIELSKKYNLPLIVHSRDALEATYKQLEKHKPIKGIMHCYSGSAEMAPMFMDLGMHISLAGPVTFKNAKVPKEVAKVTPLDKLLVETDCPYLAPHPFRGKENRAYYVTYVIDEIARLKEVESSVVEDATYNNAMILFGLE